VPFLTQSRVLIKSSGQMDYQGVTPLEKWPRNLQRYQSQLWLLHPSLRPEAGNVTHGHFHEGLNEGPQFDLGPTRFLHEGLRGAYAKVRTEKDFWKLVQSRTSKQAPTRDCLRSLSYVILRHIMPTQDLRTKQNSLRMNNVSSSI